MVNEAFAVDGKIYSGLSIDLNDYFKDDDGDELTYLVTEPENITVRM